MSQVYASAATARPSVPNLADPQTIYEALVGLRSFDQRRWLFGPHVPNYALDRGLKSGRVVRTNVQRQGHVAWVAMTVRLGDGTCRAVSLKLDRRRIRPVVSAVVL